MDALVSFLELPRRQQLRRLRHRGPDCFNCFSSVDLQSHGSHTRHLTFTEQIHPSTHITHPRAHTHTKWNLLIKQHGGIYQRYISPQFSSFIHLVFVHAGIAFSVLTVSVPLPSYHLLTCATYGISYT